MTRTQTYRVKVLFTHVIFSIMFSVSLFSQCGQLVWSDEFEGTEIDYTKWTHETGGGGWGNAELQTYTNSAANSRIENGRLIIEARNDNGNYTSARLYTRYKHSWKYGRFEMSAKLPSGTGLWPAFWMLADGNNWPMTGEIDIMELRGDWQNHIGGTLHYGANWPNNRHDGTGYDLTDGSFQDDFHVFAVEWEPGEIRWYVDEILYKTETANPNSLDPPSNNDPWPWDNDNFFMILNVAVGGPDTWYTGQQQPNFGTSGKMEVEYVRVYDAAQPSITIAGKERVFEDQSSSYSVPSASGQSYAWSVPQGATIVSGQGTNEISVNWNGSSNGNVSIDITHNSGNCSGATFQYSKPVEVYKRNCEIILQDFDDNSKMNRGYQAGEQYQVQNPGSNGVNSSALAGEYHRNGGEQWDALVYENALLDDGSQFVDGTYQIKMDVYTAAPIGTAIDIQLGNNAAIGNWPAGTHSVYTATTTTQNQWETLTFTYKESPDPAGANYAGNLDRFVLMFRPNSWTNDVYYFDNIRRELVSPNNNLTLTGPDAVDENETNINYLVGGAVGSEFDWTTPLGSTINSGQGTSGINVDFGTLGGRVTVSEKQQAGCWSEPIVKTVSVGGGSCALFSDDFDNNEVGGWMATSGQAGFSYSELVSDMVITSTGFDEWAYATLTINDGANPTTIDFTDPLNNPTLKIRAKASSNMLLRVTLVDVNGVAAANQYLNPLNGLDITTDYQEFTVDFNGQLWDEWNGGGALDDSQISEIRLSLNPAYASYPTGSYTSTFVGDINIDYIRIGDECQGLVANFNPNTQSVCKDGSVTFTDASLNTDGSTQYSWDFGAGATPSTATGVGPHQVNYSTKGYKNVTLTLNNGESIKVKDSLVYVSNVVDCIFSDDFDNSTVGNEYIAQGNFTFTEAGSTMNINSSGGHDEYEYVQVKLPEPLNLSCNADKAIIKARFKSSTVGAIRLSLRDNNGVEAQNNDLLDVNTFDITDQYTEVEINLNNLLRDDFVENSALNTNSITDIIIRLNPGYSSYPFTTSGGTLINSAFDGNLEMEWLSLGTCTIPDLNLDCHGDLNGTASIDDCGVCSGGNSGVQANSSCTQDCEGTWGGDAFLDNCNQCVGGTTGNIACVQDCNGDYGGPASVDQCGVCSGGLTNIVPNSNCTDCNGVINGTAYLDDCNTCVGGNTNEEACTQDCNGEYGGTASYDNCDVCSGGSTDIIPNSSCTQDCQGVWGGDAYIDGCNECVGGTTGKQACQADCHGDFGGSASYDQCGVCSGGNTGVVANSSCRDCNGDINGTAFMDECNTCVGGNTGLTPCGDDCAGVAGGTASVDQCGVCSGGTTGLTPNASCRDCNDVINGSASVDNCDVCSGGNTEIIPNSTCGLEADFSTSKEIVCVGDNVTFSNTTTGTVGGESYTWSFGSGASNVNGQGSGNKNRSYSTPGTKTITLTVTGTMTSVKTKTIEVIEPNTPTISGNESVTCNATGEDYTVNGLNGSSYTWSAINATIASGQNTGIATYDFNTADATITVTETTSAGCVASSNLSIDVCSVSSIDEEVDFEALFYPNPSKGGFNLRIEALEVSDCQLQVYDLSGKIIYSSNVNADMDYAFGETFGKGVYLARLTCKEVTRTYKLVKN